MTKSLTLNFTVYFGHPISRQRPNKNQIVMHKKHDQHSIQLKQVFAIFSIVYICLFDFHFNLNLKFCFWLFHRCLHLHELLYSGRNQNLISQFYINWILSFCVYVCVRACVWTRFIQSSLDRTLFLFPSLILYCDLVAHSERLICIRFHCFNSWWHFDAKNVNIMLMRLFELLHINYIDWRGAIIAIIINIKFNVNQSSDFPKLSHVRMNHEYCPRNYDTCVCVCFSFWNKFKCSRFAI